MMIELRALAAAGGHLFEVPAAEHWSIELSPDIPLIEVVGMMLAFEAVCLMVGGGCMRLLPLFPRTPAPSARDIARFYELGSGARQYALLAAPVVGLRFK